MKTVLSRMEPYLPRRNYITASITHINDHFIVTIYDNIIKNKSTIVADVTSMKSAEAVVRLMLEPVSNRFDGPVNEALLA